MLEIIVLIAAVSAIAAYARGRGGSPWFWGALAVAGYILIQFAFGFIARTSPGMSDSIAGIVLAWAWVGAVALYTRFGLGAGKPKADMLWTCSNCKYLNGSYAVICEACKQPYSKSRQGRPS